MRTYIIHIIILSSSFLPDRNRDLPYLEACCYVGYNLNKSITLTHISYLTFE